MKYSLQLLSDIDRILGINANEVPINYVRQLLENTVERARSMITPDPFYRNGTSDYIISAEEISVYQDVENVHTRFMVEYEIISKLSEVESSIGEIKHEIG